MTSEAAAVSREPPGLLRGRSPPDPSRRHRSGPGAAAGHRPRPPGCPPAAGDGRLGPFSPQARPGPSAGPTSAAIEAAASAEACPLLPPSLPPFLPPGPTHGRGEAQLVGHHGGGCLAGWGRRRGPPQPPGPARRSRRCSAGPSRKPRAEAERDRAGGCLPPPPAGGAERSGAAQGTGVRGGGGARRGAGGRGRASRAGRGGERRSSCLGARGVSLPGNPVRGPGCGGLRLWEGRTRPQWFSGRP